jgi:hypothetical protein
MRAQEIISFIRGIDEHVRFRKESNIFCSGNQQNPNINMGKRKEKTIFK